MSGKAGHQFQCLQAQKMREDCTPASCNALHGETQRAGDAVRSLLLALEGQGLDTAAILAAAHAEIVLAIAITYGGEVAAERCLAMAEKIAAIPSAHEASRAGHA